MDLLCRSPRLLYLATSVCIWNRRKKKKNAQKEKNSFFAYSKLWKESLKQIHQNSKWAFFAGLLGCCTWQQVSASGTEGIRREMCQKKKNPSLQLVNCGKKVWKQFTKNTKSVLFPPVFTFFLFAAWQRWKAAILSWFAWKIEPGPTWEEGVRSFFVQKYRKKMDQKCKWTHFSAFFDCAALQGIAASVPREKRRKVRQMKKRVVLRTFCQSPKRMKTIHPKVQMDLLCRSLRLLYLATSVCIWNRRKKKRNAQKDKNSFFASSKLSKESLKKIHPKYQIDLSLPVSTDLYSPLDKEATQQVWADLLGKQSLGPRGRRGCAIGLSPSPWPKGA